MRERWLQRIATISRWLFIIITLLLVIFGPPFGFYIYNQGDETHGAFDTSIAYINAFEHPPAGSGFTPTLSHAQADAKREQVWSDYKRDLWDTFSDPLIVLIILAIVDILCRHALKRRRRVEGF